MMKAQTFSDKRFKTPCFIMPKLNGLHAAWLSPTLVSFDQKVWLPKCLPHIYRRLRQTSICLTGEIYKNGWSLQRISSAAAVKRVSPGFFWNEVQFHVFDAIIPGVSFKNRYEILIAECASINRRFEGKVVVPVEAFEIEDIEGGNYYYQKFLNEGYEGAMYHIDDQGYEWKDGSDYVRSWQLFKRKDWLDEEFKVVAIERGEKGKAHENRMGALVCVTKTGKKFNVGGGFTEEDREKFWKKPPIGKKLTVKFLVYSDAGVPLNGSSLGIREQL